MEQPIATQVPSQQGHDKRLFLACFVALVTTSFGFIVRALTLPQWGDEFNLTSRIKITP